MVEPGALTSQTVISGYLVMGKSILVVEDTGEALGGSTGSLM
jgi:hypothetical protein